MQTEAQPSPTTGEAAADRLRVHDARTGGDYELVVHDGAIRATDLAAIKRAPDGPGLLSYDPAFMNTASCRSAIAYIDGERGILEYRGYPIEELAGRRTFLEVAYLLIHGELPAPAAAEAWADAVAGQARVPDAIVDLIWTFPVEAHPMAVLLSAWSALGAYHPEAAAVDDPAMRDRLLPTVIGEIAAVVGLVFRHRTGRPARLPRPSRDYGASLFADLFGDGDDGPVDPVLARALDILLVLHADHEQNCSTSAVRAVGSSRVEPYAALSAGIAALYGPLHGGANEAVIRMLHEVGDAAAVPAFIERVKDGKHRLMGFGHRIYKSYDPRAKLIKETAMRVFEVTGRNPLLDVALAIEAVALHDPYFSERRLYPNVDFYSGLIYEAMGMPMDTYTTVFAVGRMAGWLAQWLEMIQDPDQKIARPRQIFVGPARRPVPG